MTTAELVQLARARLSLIHASVQTPEPLTLILIDVPEAETPSQHIRNGLMVLSLFKEQSPATWAMNPELPRAALRATTALVALDFGDTADMAHHQLRSAIEALLATDLDWDVITEVPAACGRFLIALFQLDAPEGN